MSKRGYSNQLLVSQLIAHESRRGAHMTYVGEFKRRGWVDENGDLTSAGHEVLDGVAEAHGGREYPDRREPEHTYWNENVGLVFDLAFVAGCVLALIVFFVVLVWNVPFF